MYSGGQGVYLHYLTRELAQMGHDVHVIAGLPYPKVTPEVHLHKLQTFNFWKYLYREGFEEYAYHTHPLHFFHPVNLYEFISTRYILSSQLNMFSLRAYHKLNELERETPFDLIHDNQTLGYGIWLMKLRGRPVVATVHHPLAADRKNELAQANSTAGRIERIFWYPWVMQKWVVNRLDKVITVSEVAAASLQEAFGILREDVSIISNGVDGEIFRPVEVDTEPGRVLFVGHAEDKNKGFRYLLEALRALRDQVSFNLTVVQRPGSTGTEHLVQKLGLFGRVTFLEDISTEQLVLEYNRAQIVVSPSLFEGFGLPALEAQACGTPVIATTVGALPDIVEDTVSGLIVPPKDVSALSEAIEALLQDPDRCRDMGASGRRHVLERFSWREAAAQTVQVYYDAIGQHSAA